MHVVVDTAQSVLAAGRLEIGFGFIRPAKGNENENENVDRALQLLAHTGN